MRHAVMFVLFALLVAGAFTLTQAAAQTSPRAAQALPRVVSVAVTTASVHETSSTRTDALLLWNRNERTLPIGHAIKACIKSGPGGIFGSGVLTCTMVVILPLGKITAAGVVHNFWRYTLVITGGTGEYEGVTGPMFIRSVSGDGVRRLTFSL